MKAIQYNVKSFEMLKNVIHQLPKEISIAKTYVHDTLGERSVVDRHRRHLAATFDVFVGEDCDKLPTLYWW